MGEMMKKILLSLLFLFILAFSVSARPITECTLAGYSITSDCDTLNGDQILNLSIQEDKFPDLYPYNPYQDESSGIASSGLSTKTLSAPIKPVFDENSQVCCWINDFPEITSTPNTNSLFPGEYYEYQVEANEEMYPLSFILLSSISQMNIDSETGLLTWDVTQPGNYTIEIEVSDGYYSDFQTFSIEVTTNECLIQGYVCKTEAELGDIEQPYACSQTTVCVEEYVPPVIDFPEFFWSLPIYNATQYGEDFTYTNGWDLYLNQMFYDCYPENETPQPPYFENFDIHNCPILNPNGNFTTQVIQDAIVEGDNNYWLLGYDGDEQDYDQREFLIQGNHNITTAYVTWEDTSEMNCQIQDYLVDYPINETYNITIRRLYVISYPQWTWEDDEARCEIAVDDGVTNTSINMTFIKTEPLQIHPITQTAENSFTDPLGYDRYSSRGALPFDLTVVHGEDFPLALNVSGRFASKVIWRYVWFWYYTAQGIPPEIPTAGWNHKIYDENDTWTGNWTNCTQAMIDDNNGTDIWDNCNYLHFVWMDTVYNFSLDENKIFQGTYNSTYPQWNQRDTMWRYYAFVYDHDVQWSARTRVWNIYFDNFAPGAPQNFSAHTYPTSYYPGRIGVNWAAPGDDGDSRDISFANYDTTYDETRNYGYYCTHYDQATEISRQNLSGCGWYEFKYREAELGPITEANWNDPETVLYEPSLSWIPTPNGTYDHGANHDEDPFNCLEFYPQYVPDFCKNEWVDLPEARKDYYVALRAYDGEGNAGALATDLVTSGYEYDMDIGFDQVTGINDTGWYNTFTVLDCNRDRDADKFDDCQTYKDDNGYYPPEPNWIRRTLYLGDEITINTSLCNFGNQDFNDYVYLMSYGQGGYREEDKMWVNLSYNPEWYDYNLTQEDRDQEESLAGRYYPSNCMDITFHHTIDRKSFYMYYYVEIRRNNSDPDKHPGDEVSWDDLASLNNYYQDWDFDYTFHTFSVDDAAYTYLGNCWNESPGQYAGQENGYYYTCDMDTPYINIWNLNEPYVKGADSQMIFTMNNEFDYRWPFWDFPINFEFKGVNGSNVTQYIYERSMNGPIWNWGDRLFLYNQSDEIGLRNNFTWYMTFSAHQFMTDEDHPPNDYNPADNYYFWNETLGWYQYDPAGYRTHELYWETYPDQQTLWWNAGENPGNFSWNISIGTGFDKINLPTFYAGTLGTNQSQWEGWSNRTEFEVLDVDMPYPIVNENMGCWVDISGTGTYEDTWNDTLLHSSLNWNDTLTDGTDSALGRYTQRFMTTDYYHIVSNDDNLYWRWNWTPEWVLCNETTVTTDDLLWVSYDVFVPDNPMPGPVDGLGRRFFNEPSIVSEVNGNRIVEDNDWYHIYIYPNTSRTVNMYFRPSQTGTVTFEAMINYWNDGIDVSTALFDLEVVAPGTKSTSTKGLRTFTTEEISATHNVEEPVVMEAPKKEKGFFKKAVDFVKKTVGIKVEEEKAEPLEFKMAETEMPGDEKKVFKEADWDLIEQYRIESEASAKNFKPKAEPINKVPEYEIRVMEEDYTKVRSLETSIPMIMEVVTGGIN